MLTVRRFTRVFTGMAISGTLLFSVGCEPSRVNSSTVLAKRQGDPLSLSKAQLSFIQYHAPKLLVGAAFWSGDYNKETFPDEHQVYVENTGKELPVKLISLEGAVIVFIPQLRSAIRYVKMPDGNLDYPGLAHWGKLIDIKDDEEGIRKILSFSGWSWFLFHINIGTFNLTQEQKGVYQKIPDQNLQYSEVDGTIILLPLEPPTYNGMDEGKHLLLDRIIEKAIEEAEKSYEAGDVVNITIPNFNVGDAGILFLIEDDKGGGIIISLTLPLHSQNLPIIFSGVVNYDIKAKPYGIKDDTAEIIKRFSLKRILHRIRNRQK